MRGWKQIDRDIESEIVDIIKKIPGKVTWPIIIGHIYNEIGRKYTRQTLYKHKVIRAAYESREGRGKGVREKYRGLSRSALMKKLEGIEIENTNLIQQNRKLLEQFCKWAYNAHIRGVGEDVLNRPLPPIDREKTLDYDIS